MLAVSVFPGFMLNLANCSRPCLHVYHTDVRLEFLISEACFPKCQTFPLTWFICHIVHCRTTQCRVLTITGSSFSGNLPEPYRSTKRWKLAASSIWPRYSWCLLVVYMSIWADIWVKEGSLLKMGPRVKERIALLSVSLKFTLLFTLPDRLLLQEQREP